MNSRQTHPPSYIQLLIRRKRGPKNHKQLQLNMLKIILHQTKGVQLQRGSKSSKISLARAKLPKLARQWQLLEAKVPQRCKTLIVQAYHMNRPRKRTMTRAMGVISPSLNHGPNLPRRTMRRRGETLSWTSAAYLYWFLTRQLLIKGIRMARLLLMPSPKK